MPRYNLNHEDVNIIVDALDRKASQAASSREHTRIISLRDRILLKISNNDEVDVWSAFQSKANIDPIK